MYFKLSHNKIVEVADFQAKHDRCEVFHFKTNKVYEHHNQLAYKQIRTLTTLQTKTRPIIVLQIADRPKQ